MVEVMKFSIKKGDNDYLKSFGVDNILLKLFVSEKLFVTVKKVKVYKNDIVLSLISCFERLNRQNV